MSYEEVENWEKTNYDSYIQAREDEKFIVQSFYDSESYGVLGFVVAESYDLNGISGMPSRYDIECIVRELPGKYGLSVAGKMIGDYIMLQIT